MHAMEWDEIKTSYTASQALLTVFMWDHKCVSVFAKVSNQNIVCFSSVLLSVLIFSPYFCVGNDGLIPILCILERKTSQYVA